MLNVYLSIIPIRGLHNIDAYLKFLNKKLLYFLFKVAQDQNQPEVNNHSQLPNTQQALIVLYVLLNILMFSAVIGEI